MSAIEALRTLAAGQRPADALLPPVRLFAGGAEYFGEEAVVHAFRRDPLSVSEGAEVIEADGYAAIFDGDHVLFASLYGDRIARIWRIGPGEPHDAEPAIGVPFDTDLRQARRDLAFRAEDHPALAAEAAGAIETIGRELAHGWAAEGTDAYRTRPFAIEAFSDGERGAVLFAVYRLGGDTVRSSGFFFAAAAFTLADGKLAESRIVRDSAGEAAIVQRQWRTHFA